MGLLDVEIVAEPGMHPLPTPEAAWALIMGSGYRGTVEQLGLDARDRVRARYLRAIASRGVVEIEAGVVYARARA